MKMVKTDGAAVVAPIDVDGVRTVIGEDLNRAEVGMFCMLRAGVGLLVFKELCGHGEWEQRILELGGGKAPRTLRNYMKQALEFIIAHGVTPSQAWAELVKIDPSQVSAMMIAAPAPLALGAGEAVKAAAPKKGKKAKAPDAGAGTSPQTFSQLLVDFIRQRDQQKKSRQPETPPKPLTKKEKVDAAIAEANRIVNMAADWVADGTWALLPDEELESTMAGLRAAADKLRSEIKGRK